MTSIIFVCVECDEAFSADKASYKTVTYHDAEGVVLASEDKILVCPTCLNHPNKIYLTGDKTVEVPVQ